jgi:DNA helicase-2/ATP-dependent DNA helicase PcrA
MLPLPKVLDPAEHVTTEQSFRLTAGPGAGKTTWLAKQIQYVLDNAPRHRLNTQAKLVCLTYTDVATQALIAKLSTGNQLHPQLHISTLHRFLFDEVVRPYTHLLHLPRLATQKIKSRGERFATISQVEDYLKEINQFGNINPATVREALSKLQWELPNESQTEWTLRFPIKIRNLEGYHNELIPIGKFESQEALLNHKSSLWQLGLIDHEDSIRFAYDILSKHPNLIRGLSARFPYFFVDEFQDTTECQLRIITKFIEIGKITIGLIGDPNQSIYEFAGVKPALLNDFFPTNAVHYNFINNRRSTKQIVEILNTFIPDTSLHQTSCIINADGPKPLVIVGNISETHEIACQHLKQRGVNSTTNALHCMSRWSYEVVSLIMLNQKNPLDQWRILEGSFPDWARFFNVFGTAICYIDNKASSKIGFYLKSLFQDEHPLPPLISVQQAPEIEQNNIALRLFHVLWLYYKQNKQTNALEIYNHVQQSDTTPFFELAQPNQEVKTLLEQTPFNVIIEAAKLKIDRGLIRTIHKFKGDQANAVLLYLPKLLQSWSFSDTDANQEETRLLYVALSRAERHLFVAVEKLSKKQEKKLQHKGFDIERAPSGITRDTPYGHDDPDEQLRWDNYFDGLPKQTLSA